MKKNIILTESQLKRILMQEVIGPQRFKGRDKIGYTENEMLDMYKKISPHAYTDDELVKLYNNLKSGDESSKLFFFNRIDEDMSDIEKLCGNLMEKITHDHMYAQSWYLEPDYVSMLRGTKGLNDAKLKIFGDSYSFYQMILAVYQNPILWNNLFFDPKYENARHLFNRCVVIAKGKLASIMNDNNFKDLDTLNAIKMRKNASNIDGRNQISRFTSPISVKTFGKALMNLIPAKELQTMIDFRKNKANANPDLFYQNTTDTDNTDEFNFDF